MEGRGPFNFINCHVEKDLLAALRSMSGVNIGSLINSQFLKRFELNDLDVFKAFFG